MGESDPIALNAYGQCWGLNPRYNYVLLTSVRAEQCSAPTDFSNYLSRSHTLGLSSR